MLVGVLSHSGAFRGWVTSGQDQPHLVEGIDAVLRRLGGTARRWPSITGWEWMRAHRGVLNAGGVVEKAIHYVAQRWWRIATVTSLGQAQDSLDEFCVSVGDSRRRGQATVGELAAGEPLLELPPLSYPAEGALERKVAANGLVSVWGNRYSVPPGVIGTQVTVRWRLADPTISMFSAGGRLVAIHRKAPRGLGRTVRLPEHTAALENVVLAAFTIKRPCKPKPNRPPTAAALAIASGIRGETLGAEPVIDLRVYQRHGEAQTRRQRS